MYWRFDADKFTIQQLPPLLRRKGIYSLIRSLLVGINWIYDRFLAYREDVSGKLSGNGFVANLEKLLNEKLGVASGTILIVDYVTDNVYLHFYEEVAEKVYMSFADEGNQLILSSDAPGNLTGGFKVMIPMQLYSAENLATIRQWVDYYKYAGTLYKIETYE